MWGTIVVIAAFAVLRASGNGVIYPELRDSQGIDTLAQSRITSGWEAEEGQFPFMVLLRNIAGPLMTNAGTVTACGASLLHHEWALTAAHCTASASHVIIRVGTLNVSRPYLIFESTEYYNHPLFNEATPAVVQIYDIGLIKFPVTLEYSHLIQPIRIQRSADRSINYFGKQLFAAGWGLLWSGGSSPQRLNWVYLRGETNERCLEDMTTIGAAQVVAASTICARGWNDTTQSTCQGDSGGPLAIIEEDGLPTVVGITSFVANIGCHVDLPAGFVRPGFFHNFLTDVTGINFDW